MINGGDRLEPRLKPFYLGWPRLSLTSPLSMSNALEAVNTVGSGALSSATGIAAGPAWSMLYVGLGAAFLLAIAGLIIYFVREIRA